MLRSAELCCAVLFCVVLWPVMPTALLLHTAVAAHAVVGCVGSAVPVLVAIELRQLANFAASQLVSPWAQRSAASDSLVEQSIIKASAVLDARSLWVIMRRDDSKLSETRAKGRDG